MIKCPCCLETLKITHRDRYESLDEHVSNPNGTPSLKDGFQCVNAYCIANNLDATWLADGDFFFRELPAQIKYSVAKEAILRFSKEGQLLAVGSWNYYYEKGNKAIKKRSFFLNFYLFKIEMAPREKGHRYPLEKQYNPSLFRWKVSIWKRSKNGYLHVIPFWRMATYCVRKFNFHFADWVEDHRKASLDEAYSILSREKFFGSKDNRFYSIFTSFFLKVFYYRKSKKVIFDHKNADRYQIVTNHLGFEKNMLLNEKHT